jgi:hypothetical protein
VPEASYLQLAVGQRDLSPLERLLKMSCLLIVEILEHVMPVDLDQGLLVVMERSQLVVHWMPLFQWDSAE